MAPESSDILTPCFRGETQIQKVKVVRTDEPKRCSP